MWTKGLKNKKDNIILGKVYSDGSFAELIKIYNEEDRTLQIKFLMGCDTAYTFLPKCNEFLEILNEGVVGVSMKMIAKILIDKGYKEI